MMNVKNAKNVVAAMLLGLSVIGGAQLVLSQNASAQTLVKLDYGGDPWMVDKDSVGWIGNEKTVEAYQEGEYAVLRSRMYQFKQDDDGVWVFRYHEWNGAHVLKERAGVWKYVYTDQLANDILYIISN